MLVAVLASSISCRRENEPEDALAVVSRHHTTITAFIDADAPSQKPTVEILRELETRHPRRVAVQLFDINDRGRGTTRWRQAELESAALKINGSTTVSWGEGDARRTVSFLHPPGFAWTHQDLRDALDAALRDGLRPAEPEEAEGVRLLHITARGQSIRVGDSGEEKGQLIINDRPVINVTRPRGQLAPGQRVSLAAKTLQKVLETAFTPNQIRTQRTDDGVALLAREEPLMVATAADAEAEDTGPQALADRWQQSLRHALISAALARASAPPDNQADDD